MELFLYYLAVVFGLMIIFFVGTIYGWSLHQRMVARKIQNAMERLTSAIGEDVIHINIEKHDGMIYVYDKETKQFMAQGKTRSDVEAVLAEKYPGQRFIAAESEIKAGLSE